MAAITRQLGSSSAYHGRVETVEAGEVIGALDAIKLVGSKAFKATSTPNSGVVDEVSGIAVSSVTAAGQAILYVANGSLDNIASGQTKGAPVYLAATKGGWDNAKPASGKALVLLGWWKSASSLILDISNTGIIA